MRTNSTKKIKAATKEVFLKRGATFMDAKNYPEAISCYSEALLQLPNDAQLHYCHGVALHNNKNILLAIGSYCNALQINPKLVEAYENLSEAQLEYKLFEDAELSIRAALALKPNRALNHTRLARILTHLNQYKEAISVASHSLSLDPKSANTHMVRSSAYRRLNQLNESISDLRQAISLDPNKPEYFYNLSFDLLLNQHFDEGWSYYESRFKTKNFLLNTPQLSTPQWNGADSISNKTILVYPEQGLGDQIQFSRYALLLVAMGAKVILPVDPPLLEIVQSIHPDVFVTSSAQPISALPAYDFHIPLMSLMRLFKTDLTNIPYTQRYLAPSTSVTEKWQKRFSQKQRLQVGITWSGSLVHVNDHNRSMSLAQLEPLLGLDVDWHVLQTEIRTTDESLLQHYPIKDWRSELTNLHETAGLLDQLDLLITVDTSVAHLSAALGKPTWIMLPYAPDFRWLLNRTNSPWYPSVQLFRQPDPQDWTSVVRNIYETLTRK
jgi:tetratricopeptide (TPR) repeat protein